MSNKLWKMWRRLRMSFFCLTNSSKFKDIQFTIISVKIKKLILTFELLLVGSLINQLIVSAVILMHHRWFPFWTQVEEAWRWKCGTSQDLVIWLTFSATMRASLDIRRSGSTPCPTPFLRELSSVHDPEASLSLQPAATSRFTSSVMTDAISTSATPAVQKIR